MKNYSLSLLALLLLSGILCPLRAQEAFAPLAKAPANPENDPEIALAITFIKDAKVPTKVQVGIPAFPGAQVIQTHPGQEGLVPSVRLLSTTELAKVVAFYKQELPDWEYAELYGTHLFWKGDKQEALFGQIPNVQVADAKMFVKTLPEAKSTILVGYSKEE